MLRGSFEAHAVSRLRRTHRGSNRRAVALLSRAGVLLGLVGSATLVSPRAARAEPQTPFRVESLPGATCSSGDPFAAQLLRRTERVREAVGDEPAVVFRLDVNLGKNRAAGRLTVREPDGSELERDVAGASCQEVVSAMVLIAAILLDPNASLEPLPVPEPPRPPPPPPRAPPSSDRPAPVGPVIPAGRTPPTGALVRPRATIEKDARRRASASRPESGVTAARAGRPGMLGRLTAGGGVGFALEGAPMPKVAAGVAILGSVSLERRSILSPLLEGSGVRTQTVRADTPSGRAEFGFSSVRLLACPVRFPAVSVLAVRPCALGELGELVGIGKVTEHPALVVARWAAVGVALRAGVRLVGPLALVGQGALVVPLIRHQFYFDPHGPETTALEVPASGFSGRVGVAAEFE
jgi:hypothetical protein